MTERVDKAIETSIAACGNVARLRLARADDVRRLGVLADYCTAPDYAGMCEYTGVCPDTGVRWRVAVDLEEWNDHEDS